MAAGICPERFVGCILLDGFGMWNHSFDGVEHCTFGVNIVASSSIRCGMQHEQERE